MLAQSHLDHVDVRFVLELVLSKILSCSQHDVHLIAFAASSASVGVQIIRKVLVVLITWKVHVDRCMGLPVASRWLHCFHHPQVFARETQAVWHCRRKLPNT